MPQHYNPQQQQRGMDMRQVGQNRRPMQQGDARVQTSPVKQQQQQQQQRSISPVQPSYQPASPYNQRPIQQSQYPPSRPHLQVQVTAPANPFVDPPRAAFAAPPSPTLSSTDTLVASPKNLLHSPSLQTLNGSTVSRTDPDNDRLAPARTQGDGQDFWKRFSMVAHDAEMEKRDHPEESGSDPWLSKEFRGSRKFKYSVWAVGLICVAAIAGGLAWHFTHNDNSNKLTAPTQHDFGLGGTSSVVRTGFNAAGGGGSGVAQMQTTAAVAVAPARNSPVADADANIASAEEVDDSPTLTELVDEPTLPTTTRRAATTSLTPTVLATSTRVRATSSSASVGSRSALDKRMHRHHRRST